MPKIAATTTSTQKFHAKKELCDMLELGSAQAFLCVIELPRLPESALSELALLCEGLKERAATFIFRAHPAQVIEIAEKIQSAPRFRVVSADAGTRPVHAAAADLWVFYPTKEASLQRIFTVMQAGAVPVLYPPKTIAHLFHDYSPQREQGNSFLVAYPTAWSVFSAIVRAQENYAFPYDWGLLRTAVSKFSD